jgi:predicted CXXCH cytochrome family protein
MMRTLPFLLACVAWLTACEPTPASTEPLLHTYLGALTVPGEGCTICHTDHSGLAPDHASIGCRICHLGDASTLHPVKAHQGLARVPGDLSNARQTCGVCHGAILDRVETSLMATGRGLVAVDRWVFGEQPTPDGDVPLTALGDSPADQHLRQLCVRCHLATPKTEPAPITERSRGGGCTACHRAEVPGASHPRLTAAPTDLHCFGCHSRSGRISLSYAGWGETSLGREDAVANKHRVLQDGRVLAPLPADVHHTRGMACVDCHTARDTMGDGQEHLHQNEAVEIRCAHCHRANKPPTTTELPPEDAALLRLRTARGGKTPAGSQFVLLSRDSALHNVRWVDDHIEVDGKLDLARTWRPKAPASACQDGNHDRLTCQSCHTGWSHQCVACHTTFDPTQAAKDGNTGAALSGTFVERMSPTHFEPPVLGRRGDLVDLFVPGMIMQLQTKAAAEPKHWRLYAPAVPHTTTTGGRTCVDCHRNPLAVGFGRGTLTPTATGWAFDPTYERLKDGLPADAWTGVFEAPKGPSTTRTNAGPLSPTEQRTVLRVGRCLGCHQPDAAIFADFESSVTRMPDPCGPSPAP